MDNSKLITKMKSLVFGEETIDIKMESVEAIQLLPVVFEKPDGEDLAAEMEVELEDGEYQAGDVTFTVLDGKISEIKGEEEVEETEETPVEEQKEEIVEESMSAEVEDLKKELETLKNEKIEMSAQIEKLGKSPATEEVVVKETIMSKETKSKNAFEAFAKLRKNK